MKSISRAVTRSTTPTPSEAPFSQRSRTKSPDPSFRKRAPLFNHDVNTQEIEVEIKERSFVSKTSFSTKQSSTKQSLPTQETTSCSQVVRTTEVRFMAKVGENVWCAERDGSISIRNGLTGQVEFTIDFKETQFCWCILYVEATSTVWTGFSGGQIRLYDAETYEFVKEILQHAGGVYCLTYGNDCVFSGSNDFECFQWDAVTHEFLHQFSGHKNSIRCIVVAGPILVTGSDDYSVRIWNIVSGECIRELNGHRGGVLAAVKCGDKLWTASEDATIRIWNIEDGSLVHTITTHTGRVPTLLRTDDTIWSAGVDHTICHHNAKTFQLLGRYTDHSGYVNHLVSLGQCTKYSIWSSSFDKTIRLWAHEAGFKSADSSGANVEDLLAMNKALKEHIASLEASRNEMQSELTQSHTDNATLIGEIDKMKAQYTDTVEDMESFRKHCGQLQAALDAAELRNKTSTEQSKAELAMMQERFERLQKSSQSTIDDLQAQLNEKETALQDTLASLQEQTDFSERLQAIFNDLQHVCKDNETQMQAQKAERAQLMDRQKQQLQTREEAIADLESQIASLKETVRCRDEKLEALTRTLQENGLTIHSLTSEIATLTSKLEMRCKMVSDLETQLSQVNAEMGQRTVELQAEREKSAILQEKLNGALKRMHELDTQLAGMRNEMARRDEAMLNLKKDRDEWQRRSQQRDAEFADLQAKFLRAEGELSALCEERDALSRELKSLQDALDETNGSHKSEKDRAMMLTQKLNAAGKRIQELETQMSGMRSEMARRDEAMSTMKKDRDEWQSRSQQCDLDLEDLQTKLTHAEADLEALHNEHQATLREFQSVQTTLEESNASLKNEKERSNTLTQKLNAATKRIRELEGMMNAAKIEVGGRDEQLASLKREKEEWLELRDQFEHDIEELHKQLGEMEMELKSCQLKNSNYKTEVSELNSKIDELRSAYKAETNRANALQQNLDETSSSLNEARLLNSRKDDSISSLHRERDLLRNERDALVKQTAEISTQGDNEVRALKQKLMEKTDELHRLSAKVEAVSDSLKVEKDRSAALYQQFQNSERMLAATEDKLASSVADAKRRAEQLATLQSQHNALITIANEQEHTVEELHRTVMQRETELQSLHERHANVTEESAECKSTLGDLQTALRVEREKTAGLQQKLASMTQNNRDLDGRLKISTEELRRRDELQSALKRENDRLEQTRQSLQSSVEQRDRELQKLTDTFQAELEKSSVLQQKLNSLLVNVDELNGHLREAQIELKQHVQTINSLQHERDNLRSERDSIIRANGDSNSKLLQREGDVSAMQRRLDAVTADLERNKLVCEELKSLLRAEKEKVNELQQKLLAAGQNQLTLEAQMRAQTEDIRRKDERLAVIQRDRDQLNKATEAFHKEREDYQKQQVEFEFVLQSRSELVRQIWDLFCELCESRRRLKSFLILPAVKQLSAHAKDAAAITEVLDQAKARNKRIVANFFTDVEKFHLGTSPYYFRPDEDAVKYRPAEGANLEVFRKFTTNDPRNAGIMCQIRPRTDIPSDAIDEGDPEWPPATADSTATPANTNNQSCISARSGSVSVFTARSSPTPSTPTTAGYRGVKTRGKSPSREYLTSSTSGGASAFTSVSRSATSEGAQNIITL